MILHIPHASPVVPSELRDQIILSDAELSSELILMTDAFTDELFCWPQATTIRFPWSRLIIDVERFRDDDQEPMSRVGMGVVYTHTAHGDRLRRDLQVRERAKLMDHYDSHHQRLHTVVQSERTAHGSALIVDCHSFPSQPLPCDTNQSVPRPDFCIGTDSFHTPVELIHVAAETCHGMGYSVEINQPYAGTMIPLAFYKRDCRVLSIMIEVNRRLYMDEVSGVKNDSFSAIQQQIGALLASIGAYQGPMTRLD